jgi:DNA topoisomerase IA
VAVKLLVERENEIKNFKTQEYWELLAKLKINNEELKIKLEELD